MRRRTVALAVILMLPSLSSAQGPEQEGALFLRTPIGARGVGLGQAVSATRMGADGIWWNPASLAWTTTRESTLDHAQNFAVTGDAIDVVVPAGRLGVLSASLVYFNFGKQDAVDQFGTTLGSLSPHALVAAATYSATFGDRFAVGLTYKWLQQSQDCSGACPGFDTYAVSTSAFDFGVQAIRGKQGELSLGAVVKNLGFCLQTIDTEQCDPLPTRVHLGAEYRFDQVSKAMSGATLRVAGEIVTGLERAGVTYRGGVELGIADRLFIRGGTLSGGSGDGSAAAIGFGIRQGTLGLDFARTFGGLSSDAGSPPTYVTFRIAFR